MPTTATLPRPRSKSAFLGGDGQDTQFEQSFSNLAHAYLADKAPSLLDHEQGFQLLDRNEENTKAVGVFGFKVGSNQLYAPVFFLQGDLKGHELLYLKNQDLFVPLKENWLNYLLNRKPHILGEGTGRQTSSLGVMSPDLSRLRGTMKSGSWAGRLPEWVQPFAIKYAALIEDGAFEQTLDELQAHCRERLDFGHFMKMAGIEMLEILVDHCQQHPTVAHWIDENYGIDMLQEAVKTAAARPKIASALAASVQRARPAIITGSALFEKKAEPNQKLKVLTYDTTVVKGLPEGLDEKDQEKLLADKILIKDERGDDEVSVPYNVATEKQLFNPQETGLYWVLTKPGTFEKCLIIINPHGPHGRKPFATVVSADGTKNWVNSYPCEIWATSRIEGKDYDSWYDGLSEVGSLEKGDKRIVLVGPRGNGTVPFKVLDRAGTEDDTYNVDFSMYAPEPTGYARRYGHKPYECFPCGDDDGYSTYRDGQRIHIDAKEGTRLRSSRGDLYVPKGYKILKAEPSGYDKNQKDSDGPVACGDPGMSNDYSEDRPIQLGNLVDAEMGLMMKMATVKIAHSGTEVWINERKPITPMAALVHLVRDHGLREDMAKHMLKTAEARRSMSYRIKYANPYLTNQGPSAPSQMESDYSSYNPMGFAGPTQEYQEYEQQVPGMDAASYDHSGYDVRPEATQPGGMSGGGGLGMDQQQIARGQASGQKELMDTAMIGSMLKAKRDDTMIDQYLPDIIKGMDRKGRLLFQFYAHGDKFAERYGKQDMPELEDSLRNAFEDDGDVAIFLKQKTIEPYPEQADAVSSNLESAKQ
jgi:TusA-related sulfurtransferase